MPPNEKPFLRKESPHESMEEPTQEPTAQPFSAIRDEILTFL